MSETPVLLTAKQAADLSESFRLLDVISGSTDGKGLEIYRPALSAIASSRVVCIEAERLARMEAALRYYACATTSPDFDNGIKAREALAAQEVGK